MIKYTTIKINYKKEKNEETGPSQTYKHLHIKENHKQNKKTTYGMGESICERWHRGLIFKIYKQLLQLNSNKKSNQKMDRKT